jgi:hypothetical protein
MASLLKNKAMELPMREHFQKYSRERRVCRDGYCPPAMRLRHLRGLLCHAPAVHALAGGGARGDDDAVDAAEATAAAAASAVAAGAIGGSGGDDDDGDESPTAGRGDDAGWGLVPGSDGAISAAASWHCITLEYLTTILLEVCPSSRGST